MTRREDLAWAGGLFEGEGSWLSYKGGSAQAYLGMRDLDVVERFLTVVGMGSIRLQTRKNPKHSDMWYWRVTNARDVRVLISLLAPYLGERRRAKAAEILDATANWKSGTSKYKTHCKRGHEFTEENTYRQRNALAQKGWTRRCRACSREKQRRNA